MQKSICLNGSWNLYYCNDTFTDIKNPHSNLQTEQTKINAQVPCNVETALADANIIPDDLFKGTATEENMKFEDYHWYFEKEFTIEQINPNEKISLSFGMVDCLAEYYVNDTLVHTSDNAFCEIKFDITNYIKKGKNTILVHIMPTMQYVLSQEYSQRYIAGAVTASTFLRKPYHSFGWDIMPRAVSAGIYRDVNLIINDKYSIDELSILVTEASEKSAYVRFCVTIDIPYHDYKKM